jgi:hypothetical protein
MHWFILVVASSTSELGTSIPAFCQLCHKGFAYSWSAYVIVRSLLGNAVSKKSNVPG